MISTALPTELSDLYRDQPVTIRIVDDVTGKIATRFTLTEREISENNSVWLGRKVAENFPCLPLQWSVNGQQIRNFDEGINLEDSLFYSKTFLKSVWIVSAFLHVGENTPGIVKVLYLKETGPHETQFNWSRLETVQTLLDRIIQQEGITPGFGIPELTYSGKRMKPESVKAYHSISHTSTPTLRLRFKGGTRLEPVGENVPGKIFVKTLTGRLLDLKWSRHDTIETLKLRIQGTDGIPPDQQRLVFERRQLEDSDMKQDLVVPDEGAMIHLVLGLRGGGGSMFNFADVSNGAARVVQFSKSAPDWRVVQYGLNVEGVCKNYPCRAYGKQVISPQNYGVFDMTSKTTAYCPICRFDITPAGCGFCNCKYRFWGGKIERTLVGSKLTPFRSDWIEAPTNEYATFTQEHHGTASWERLVIETAHSSNSRWANEWSEKCMICLKSRTLPEEQMVAVVCCKVSAHVSCLDNARRVDEDREICEMMDSIILGSHSNAHVSKD